MERLSTLSDGSPPSDTIKCSPCVFERRTIDAVNWCTVCQEGLCVPCTDSHKEKHHLEIPVSGLTAKSLQLLSANMYCKYHRRKIEMFCQVHDEAICSLCVQQNHKDCTGCKPIEVVSNLSKSSAGFYDLEKSLSDTKQNLEKAIHSVIENKTALVLSKCSIHQEIQLIRKKINECLDHLETKLLQETERTSKECFTNIDSMIRSLETDKKKVESLIIATEDIKHVSSDTICFLGLRHTNKEFIQNKKGIEARLKELKKFEMSLRLNPIIESFQENISALGKINVNISLHKIVIQDFKMCQAQIPVAVTETRHAADTFVQKQEIKILKDTKDQLITSCLILPDNTFIFIHRNHNELFLQNSKGEVCRTLGIATGPYDACIVDENTLAISYGSLACVDIIQLGNGKIVKRIKTSGFCSGVCYGDGRVYMVVKNKGVCAVALPRGNISCLIKCPSLEMGYVAVTTAKMVYTNTGNRSLHCTNLEGHELWTFRLHEISPRGVQFDKCGNVLFTDSESDILRLVSADGRTNRVLLDSSDGLNCPFGIHFNKHKNQLLISNLTDGRALLCKCR